MRNIKNIYLFINGRSHIFYKPYKFQTSQSTVNQQIKITVSIRTPFSI